MAELKDLVSELMSLNNENLSKRVINDNDVQWCLSELYDMLASDVVEVVRCRDCKYSRPCNEIEKMEYYEPVIICESFEMNDGVTAVYPSDFCIYGEREG